MIQHYANLVIAALQQLGIIERPPTPPPSPKLEDLNPDTLTAEQMKASFRRLRVRRALTKRLDETDMPRLRSRTTKPRSNRSSEKIPSSASESMTQAQCRTKTKSKLWRPQARNDGSRLST